MIFCEVVGQVGGTGTPVDTEHLLRFLASHPKEAHVPRLASFAQHILVADTVRCGVVCLDGCLSLRMTRLDQSVSCEDGFSCVKEDCSHFSFGGACHDCLDQVSSV